MRKNNRLIVLIMSIVMLCSFSSCGLAHDNMKKELTEHQKAWIADIDGPLREGLEKAAGVDEFLSNEERNARLDRLIERIGTECLDDFEIICAIEELISDIRIAHINFFPGDEYQEGYGAMCCIVGEWFADGFYITATSNDNRGCIGARLVAINGIDLEEILNRYDRIYSNETRSWLKYKFEHETWRTGFIQRELEYLGIVEKDVKEVVFSFEKGGKQFEENFKIYALDELQNLEIVSIDGQIDKLPYGELVYRENGEPPFYYEIDKENKVMYFQYNECMDAKDSPDYPNFAETFDRMIEEMKANEAEIDCLVIDLRNNSGGSEVLLNNALEKHFNYLVKYPIKVLIGKAVFSAGQDAIDMLLHMFDDVTLYGEETGQAIHNYTAIAEVYLENTGGLLYITQHEDFCRAIHKRAEDMNAGVMPDVEVLQTFEGYLSGLDEVYLRAIRE